MIMNSKLAVSSIIASAAALASVQLLAPVAAQAQATWTVVASADANTGNNNLEAVTSIAASDVWAVGNTETSNGAQQALTEHWNGTAWSIVASPTVLNSTLNGVAATSTSDVWAAGSFLTSGSVQQALFEHWNGHRWAQVKSPATGPGTVISGVAAVSATDIWAVGDFLSGGSTDQTLTENFNGHKWSVVPSPNVGTGNSRLDAVAAVSATNVWAVGAAQNANGVFQTLIEHWDGTAWSVVPSPSPSTGSSAELDSVGAVSGSDVWAAGDSGSGTLTEQWNGTAWAVVTSPSPSTVSNNLTGIAVVSANDIWAVGSSLTSSFASQTLIEQWNGTAWAVVTSPTPGSAATLNGASADTESGQSWAVGSFTAANGAQQTLSEFNP
jgi:hypothetical protein